MPWLKRNKHRLQIPHCLLKKFLRRLFIDQRRRRVYMPGNLLSDLNRFLLLMDDIGNEGPATAMRAGFFDARPITQHECHMLLQRIRGIGPAFLRNKKRG